MTDLTSNDNQPPVPHDDQVPDAMGQAAMLLVESLLHMLISRSVITIADAVEVVEVATDVKAERAVEYGDTRATMEHSLAILGSVHRSLSQDLSAS